MAEISSLHYPLKSHRKPVLLPKHSAELAEFFGVMMGDGGINNPWQAKITLNAVKDKNYCEYLTKLIENLFGITPVVRKQKYKKAVVIYIDSVTIVDFLVNNGLIRGNKLMNGLRIPLWILGNKSYEIACIRGLMDTDGCLFIHRHTVSGKKYNNLGLCFCSFSVDLIHQAANILRGHEIIPHISNWGRDIYLYKADAVIKYLKIFGTSNDRIISVYETWRNARAV